MTSLSKPKERYLRPDQVSALAEEIKAILTEAHALVTVEMIASKYMIGEAIIKSPLYRKHAKTQSQLLDAIGREAGMRSTTLAECVKFYETYPSKRDPMALAEKIYTEHGAWRNVRAMLYGSEVVSADWRNHEHQFKKDPNFIVESCECGSRKIKLA